MSKVADDAALIRAEGISVRRGTRSVLSDVDLRIRSGEVVTVVGLNGAGKTTLIRVVLGLVRPDGGRVIRRSGLRIGYTPQHLRQDRSLPLSVGRFMSLGARREVRERIGETLEEVGAARLLNNQLSELSGGELHRVMLARALLRRPDLLVLDEPLAGIDVSGQADLYHLLSKIRDRHGCGVLLVSHDLHLVMRETDQVVCLNQHVCCTGHPETVASHPEFISLFGDRIARDMGVYVHRHDHRHAEDGSVIPEPLDTGTASRG